MRLRRIDVKNPHAYNPTKLQAGLQFLHDLYRPDGVEFEGGYSLRMTWWFKYAS